MARPYRLQAEGCFYHITSRGNDRKTIYTNEKDCEKFIEYLATAKEKFKFYLHAYCLMANHYHLFLEITQANLSRIMQYVNTAYTIYYNVKRNKTGHLFRGRYKSILVEQDAYYAELTRYIHLNPVRAKITAKPADYRWSSYSVYMTGKSNDCVDIDRVKQFLGMDLKQYGQFVESALIKDYPDPLKNVYAGFILGRTQFIKEKLEQLRIDVESKDFAHKRAIKNITDPQDVIKAVAGYYKLDPVVMRTSMARPMIAKRAAIYLLRKKTGLTNAQIGEMFHMTYAAVSVAAIGFKRKMERDKKIKAEICEIEDKF